MDLKRYLSSLKAIGYGGGVALGLYEQDYETVTPAAVSYLNHLMQETTRFEE